MEGLRWRGNTQQEGMRAGLVRDERRSRFTPKCKYGSGTLLRGVHHTHTSPPPPGLGPGREPPATAQASAVPRNGRALILSGHCENVRRRRVADCCSSPVPLSLLLLSAARYHGLHVQWQRDGVSAALNNPKNQQQCV